MAGIERVEAMVMRRKLCWLGHVELMDDTHLPKCHLVCKTQVGKCSAGDQKRRWNDLVLKPCPHYKPDSMRIHGSGLNLLPIRFDRVCTIVLQCELDPDELYIYACDFDRCR